MGIGRLRLVDGKNRQALSPTDIAIFKNLPNDLVHIAGVISEGPQTPLSHVNLRAKQNGMPNAYVKNASKAESKITATTLKKTHVSYLSV